MTGYVVLPPGHVTMACLQVLPSEVPGAQYVGLGILQSLALQFFLSEAR